jgi:hypothetical protein
MQLFGAIVRRLMCTVIVLMMVVAPAQFAAAAVQSPDATASAPSCAQKPCDCDKAKPDCLKSAICASQCVNAPMTFGAENAGLLSATGVFDPQESVEPTSRTSDPIRRPPRI